MKTITLQIGNSDDKLTQREWADFVRDIGSAIAVFKGNIHFSGGSPTDKPWQNYCWVFEIENDPLVAESFKRQLTYIRGLYKQDSVAWTEGSTLFV